MPLTISAVGDISLGDHPVRAGNGLRKAFRKNKDNMLSQVSDTLTGSDITIGNLESVTSNKGLNKFWLPSYEMRGDPDLITYLKNSGFNLLGVANNHAMQHGLDAFSDMIELLKKNGIDVIGYDTGDKETEIFNVQHDNVSSAFVAFSTRPEEWTTERVSYSLRTDSEILDEIRIIRDKIDGFLVCSIHWGLEFLDYPGPEQVSLGHKLIDSGVDVIFGHHPHVLQPVEQYKHGLIFYSLGNFIFDMWDDACKLAGIAQVTLTPGKLPQYAFKPVKINDSLEVGLPDKNETNRINTILNPVNPCYYLKESMTDSRESRKSYVSEYNNARLENRHSGYKFFLKNIYKYPPHYVVQSLGRTLLRRLTGN